MSGFTEGAGTEAGALVQAVLLAGGRGQRLGCQDKARLLHHGRPLISTWREALEERGVLAAVVGPEHLGEHLGPGISLTQEKPAYGGPAAAVRAGVLALGEQRPWTLLLAVDVVDPAPLLDWLLRELVGVAGAHGGEDLARSQALIPEDRQGKLQYLSAAVATATLWQRAASFSAAEVEGRPLRVLVDDLSAVLHPRLPQGLGEDVDTPEDAAHHRVTMR